MWRGKSVAVIFPTYNEKDSIRAAAFDFQHDGLADEVIVVNNNAAPGTSEEVAGTGARELFEPQARVRERAALRHRQLPCGPDRVRRAGRNVQRPRPAKTAGLFRRRAGGFRHAHQPRVHLGGRQHGTLPAVGKLGRRQDDGAAVQHHHPDGHGLHVSVCFIAKRCSESVRTSPSAARTSGRNC